MVDGHLNFNTRVDTRGFDRGVGGISKSLGKLGKLALTAFSFKALAQMGAQAIEIASDLDEVQNVVDKAFGNMAYKVEDFANSSIKQFGMSRLSAKQTASTYMSMAKSMGLAMEDASDMAINVAKLTGDVASFYNLDQEVASTKLKSIFTGETESLKDLGVVMTETNLKEFALSQGITKSYSAMSQAEKVTLRYAYVTNALGDSVGDFADTSNSWANQTRILKEQWKELLGIFGGGLINALTPAIRVINGVLQALINVANIFSQITSKLFGKQTKITSVDNLSDGMGDFAGATDDAAGAQNDLAGATEKANKAAKKQLATFDSLNILASDTADSVSKASKGSGTGSSGSSGSLASLYPTVQTVEEESETISKKLEEMLKPLKEIDFTNLKNAVSDLKEALAPLKEKLGEGLEWLYFNVLVPLAKWTIEDALPAFIELLASVLRVLNSVIDAIKPALNWLWEKFLKPLADWTGGVIVQTLKSLTDILNSLADLIDGKISFEDFLKDAGGALVEEVKVLFLPNIEENRQKWEEVKKAWREYWNGVGEEADAVANAWNDYWDGVGEEWTDVKDAFSGYFKSLKTEIKNKWDDVKKAWKEYASGVAEEWDDAKDAFGDLWGLVKDGAGDVWVGIKTKWNDFKTWMYDSFVVPIRGYFSKTWDDMKDGATKAFTGVKTAWNEFKTWVYEKFVVPFRSYFTTTWSNLKTGAKNAWEGVKSVFSNVATFFKTTFSNAWEKVKGVFSSGGKVFTGIKDGIVTSFKTIVNKLIDGINRVIRTPFNALNTALNKVRNVSILGAKPFEKLIKANPISVPQIPKLASGAIIPPNGEFLAVLGDQTRGRNLEAPESLIRQIVREESGNSNITVTLELDGDTVAKKVFKVHNNTVLRTGSSPLAF